MVAPPESMVGRFRMGIQESTEPGPQPQDRAEAIANWLFKQWQNNNCNQTERLEMRN
jgi:hypothetical protein